MLILTILACKKQDVDVLTIEGIVRDDASKSAIAGVTISIDAIKSSSGWGILTDGKRVNVARTTTDVNGYYHVKLKVFKDAEILEFYLNPGLRKDDYVEIQKDYSLSALNRRGENRVDFTLSPIALLKINYKNASPVSDSDFFSFSWYDSGKGWTKGVTKRENCGTVLVSDAFTWTGKDVCGSLTASTIAEDYTIVYWTVKKGGMTTNYIDSVFVKRGTTTEFPLNY